MASSTKIESLQSEQTEFKKGLGLFDATTLVAGSMIGSGVFVVASGMMRSPDPAHGIWGVPYPGLMLLVWVICGVITLLGALSHAELAASMPKAGGPYVFLREAFGSFWAFLYGWTLFFAIQTGTIAGVAVAFGRASYALTSHQSFATISGEVWPVRLLAVGCIVLLTIWNIFGIRKGVIIQNFFTVLKVGAIVALIALAFRSPQVDPGTTVWPTTIDWSILVPGFAAAMIGALWAYDAWVNVLFAGEEVKNAKRTLPLALILGTSITAIVYCLCNYVYVRVLPVANIQHLHGAIVGIEAARVMMGGRGALFITAAIACSTFGCMNGIVLLGPRAFYAMAKDRLFFHQMAKIHPVYQTPAVALAIQMVWSVLLVVLPGQTYDKLFTYVEFSAFLFYGITVVGLFVLRHKYPDLPRPFRVPTLIPVVYFVAVTFFLVYTVKTQPKESLMGLVLVLVGAVVYLFIGKKVAEKGVY